MKRHFLPAFSVFLLLSAVSIFCFDIRYGFYDWDAGVFMQCASMVARGFRPYVDYKDMYPPTMLLIDSGLVWVGIPRLALLFGLPLGWSAGVAVLSFALVRSRVGLGGALSLAGSLFLFAVGACANHVTLEWALVFFWLLYWWLDSRAAPAWLMGLVLGWLLLTKQVAALAIPSCLFLSCPRFGLRSWVWFGVGVLIPGVILFSMAPFESLFENLVSDLLVYGREDTAIHLDSLVTEFLRAPFLYVLLIVSFAALMRERSWALVLGGGALVGTLVYRRFPHYVFNAWPVVVGAVMFSAWAQRFVARFGVVVLLVGVLVLSVREIGIVRSSEDVVVRSFVPMARELATRVAWDEPIGLTINDNTPLFLADRVNSQPFQARVVPLCVYSLRKCHSVIEDFRGARWILDGDRFDDWSWPRENARVREYLSAHDFREVVAMPFLAGGGLRLYRSGP